VIGEGTTIGPYCIIGRNVVVGANCNLIAHVHVTRRPRSAPAARSIHSSRSAPRHNPELQGRTDPARDRRGCTIRESVTMNAGTVAGAA